MNTNVKVRIRCVVDMHVGVWGDNVQLSDLRKTAKKEGLEKLTKIMQENLGSVCGQPTVVFVMCEEES